MIKKFGSKNILIFLIAMAAIGLGIFLFLSTKVTNQNKSTPENNSIFEYQDNIDLAISDYIKKNLGIDSKFQISHTGGGYKFLSFDVFFDNHPEENGRIFLRNTNEEECARGDWICSENDKYEVIGFGTSFPGLANKYPELQGLADEILRYETTLKTSNKDYLKPSTIWISTKSPEDYPADRSGDGFVITYPKNWKFICCGDTDLGSTNLLIPFNIENLDFDDRFAQIKIEQISNYACFNEKKQFDLECNGDGREVFVSTDINTAFKFQVEQTRKKAAEFEKLDLNNNQIYKFQNHKSSENYLFKTKSQLLVITFLHPEVFGDEFISEFIKRNSSY